MFTPFLHNFRHMADDIYFLLLKASVIHLVKRTKMALIRIMFCVVVVSVDVAAVGVVMVMMMMMVLLLLNANITQCTNGGKLLFYKQGRCI